MSAWRLLSVSSLSLFLTACGGGGSDGGGAANALCSALGGGASSVQSNAAPNASFSDVDAVFDGDVSSFATLTTTGGTGSSSVRGTTQSGVVSSASVAGLLFEGELSINTNLVITTYLSGAQQDAGPATNTTSRDGLHFFGINTSANFDSIEATLNLVGDPPALKLFELCVNG